MRNTIFKWLILILLFAYAAFMAVWANAEYAKQRCTGIEVEITRPGFVGKAITQKGVVSELARFDSKLIGKKLSDINTSSIEKFLSSFSNFEEAQCVITSDGKLRIEIIPMIPELRVFDGSDSYYINKSGKRIAANAKFFIDVPIVSGHFTGRFSPASLLSVTRRIQQDSVFKNLIVMVKADSPDNIILIPRIRGHVINIGNAADLDTKFRNILVAYRRILPFRGWETYDTISVKFSNRIIATRADKTQISHTPEYEENIDFEEDSGAADLEAAPSPSEAINRQKAAPEPRRAAAPVPAADTHKPEVKKPEAAAEPKKKTEAAKPEPKKKPEAKKKTEAKKKPQNA